MSEQTQRQRVIKALFGLDPISVENRVNSGTPDVNYIEGWIELKWLRNWPQPKNPVTIRHFTPQQRVWLKRRWFRGGNAWLLLQVKSEWLLFTGEAAADFVGVVTRDRLLEVCRKHWLNGLNDTELKKAVNEQEPRAEK